MKQKAIDTLTRALVWVTLVMNGWECVERADGSTGWRNRKLQVIGDTRYAFSRLKGL